MEDRMMEVLNSTLTKYNTIYNKGHYELAEKIFYEFIAQQKLVEEVTGKIILIKDDRAVII